MIKNALKLIKLYSSVAALFCCVLFCTGCTENSTPNIPGSTANINTSINIKAEDITYEDQDTDGDGIIDYRMVGDYDGDGTLEWSDIQSAVYGLCDPNNDGVQDAADGKLTDLDGDGVYDDPFCGTLHILPGEWLSPIGLSINVRDDDQIWLKDFQGLWFRGSGKDNTILKARYSRLMFCTTHHEIGCGGICSRESKGNLIISDFTFTGLPPRTWGDKDDCDGDGRPYYDPLENNYTVRTQQSGIVVTATFPNEVRNVEVKNIAVTQIDTHGYIFFSIDNLTMSNLDAYEGGGAGFWLTGVRNSYANNLHIESYDGALDLGGLTISGGNSEPGQALPNKTQNLVIDTLKSVNNHMGLLISADGGGGIDNVTIANFDIFEPYAASTSGETQFGIKIRDSNCFWDPDADGIVDTPCYANNITFDTGSVIGSPSYGFTTILTNGGPTRNYAIRNVHFEGNGYALRGTDSHDINIIADGMIFDNNTVLANDYDNDNIIDLSHLIRVQADNVQIMNNTLEGTVSRGNKTLVLARQSDNLLLDKNTLKCNNTTLDSCVPLTFWSDVTNSTAQNNTVSFLNSAGTGVSLSGYRNMLISNTITGGHIVTYGSENSLLLNKVSTNNVSSYTNGIQLWGIDTYVAQNTCEPTDTGAVCVEIEKPAVGTILWDNYNLTTPGNLYLDWTGSANIL